MVYQFLPGKAYLMEVGKAYFIVGFGERGLQKKKKRN